MLGTNVDADVIIANITNTTQSAYCYPKHRVFFFFFFSWHPTMLPQEPILWYIYYDLNKNINRIFFLMRQVYSKTYVEISQKAKIAKHF